MRTLTIRKGASSSLALDLETVKSDLRIPDNIHDSTLLSQYIPAAIAWAEGFTKRDMVSRTVAWVIDAFPGASLDYEMRPPGGFVSTIASIVYIADGSAVTLTGPDASPAGSDFQQSIGDSWARIRPPQGETWPAADSDAIDPVTVNYSAGWADAAAVPADVKRAMTAYVYSAMELDGLLTIRPGFDIDHPEKLLSSYRNYIV